MITSFTGSMVKVLINGKQVFPGEKKIELVPGKTMTIQIHYQVTPYGDIGVMDYWTTGVTAKLGSQFGWDPTVHRGEGMKEGSPEIGNIKAPSARSSLYLKLYAIDAVNPSAPPG